MMADEFVAENATWKVDLPKFLDVYATAWAADVVSLEPEDWGLFGDNEGRVIAQRIDLVFNEPGDEDEEMSKESDTSAGHERKNEAGPGVVLVVATDSAEDLLPPSPDLLDDEEIFLNNLEKATKWVSKQENSGDSIFGFQNFEYTVSAQNTTTSTACGNDNHAENFENLKSQFETPFEEPEFDGYPCVKSDWYIQKPIGAGTLIDDTTIINTQCLAEDLRQFLRRHSISLRTFASHHLNRTQGTLSDVLNHPKRWTQLSYKGRETYIKLMEFLSSKDLPEIIAKLRRKQIAAGSGKLPDNILEPLSRGVMPSGKNIALAAGSFAMGIGNVVSHCENQIVVYNMRDINSNHSLLCSWLLDSERFSPSLANELHICSYPGCGTIFQDNFKLDIHTRSHLENKPQRCSACKRNFATKFYLNSHLKVHTNAAEVSRKGASKQTMQSIDVESDNDETKLCDMKYICGVCWRGFKSRQRLIKHLSFKHMVQLKNLNDGYTCYVCRKVTKNISALETHMRTHTNNRPYECDQCEMSFQTKANLERHIKIHTGEKPYECTVCYARFLEAKTLVVHMRIHTGERPLECKVCGKRFKQNGPFNAHMLIHEEKKPFSCPDCGKDFRQKSNMQVHMKRHWEIKNHKCSFCEMAFLTKSDHSRHVRKHTGEKPHQCEFCLKRFTRPVYLREHTARLASPSAPQCHACNKKFCNDILLKKHLVKHELEQKTGVIIRNDINTASQQHVTESFSAMDGSENNVLLLAAKSAFSNEKHYILAPMQSLDGTHEGLDDQAAIGNFQSVILAQADDTRIPFSTTSGHSVFLQSIDLNGHQVSVMGSSADMLFPADSNILSTVREMNVPISLTDEDGSIKNTHEIMEGRSDPNMQCAVAKSADDTVILTQDIQAIPEKRIKLSDTGEPCQVIVTNPATDANLPVVITMSDSTQVNAPVCHADLVSESVLVNAHQTLSESDVTMTAEDSKGQTYIIVDLEL